MPSIAPTLNTWSNSAAIVSYWLGSPHELLTMLARWLSTMYASAFSRSASSQLAPAT